jgi:hypothetical protein
LLCVRKKGLRRQPPLLDHLLIRVPIRNGRHALPRFIEPPELSHDLVLVLRLVEVVILLLVQIVLEAFAAVDLP